MPDDWLSRHDITSGFVPAESHGGLFVVASNQECEHVFCDLARIVKSLDEELTPPGHWAQADYSVRVQAREILLRCDTDKVDRVSADRIFGEAYFLLVEMAND